MTNYSRRDVLMRLAVLGGGAAAFGAVGETALADDAPAAVPVVWVNVGPLPDMKVNDMQRIAIPNSTEVVFVKRASDKDYAAFSARCTHRGATIAYDAGTLTFTCPRHGAQFDNMGNVVKGPAQRPLVPLAVKFDDKKNLWVQSPPSHDVSHNGPPPSGLPQ